MPKIYKRFTNKIVYYLKTGKVGVIPTDTIYGIVASALNYRAVTRVYRARKRERNKKSIILIGGIRDLLRFGVKLTKFKKDFLRRYWPGKVSVDLPVKGFLYLARGTGSLAFRLPAVPRLRRLLKLTGPLVAPSANIAGAPPSYTVKEAQRYFGNKIDFYVDAGRQNSKPSTVVKFENGKAMVIREGAVKIHSG